jgi:serine/threonine-protein kinase
MLPALLDEPGFAERFRAEARTMARLKHPGVVNVYDYSSDAQAAFLVMEYVDGDPLSRTLARVGRLTAARTMALIAQAADALEAAHAAGIVHRDVKPGNLMVRANGTLVLTDFGISRSELASQLTGTGTVLGTASYLSPEQAAGQVATPASDLYALGVVAYQCLAGRRPFEGDNPLEIAMKHVQEPPPPLPSDIPPAVREIVIRALAKDPAGRWPSAATLAAVARQAAVTLGSGIASYVPPGSPSSPAPGRPGSPAGHGPPVPVLTGSPPGTPVSPHVPAPPPYHPGQVQAPSPPAPYRSPVATPAGLGVATTRPGRDRPAPLAVVAAILFAVAVVLCAGLVGYLVRQTVDGRGIPEVFSMIAYDQLIEGSMTT